MSTSQAGLATANNLADAAVTDYALANQTLTPVAATLDTSGTRVAAADSNLLRLQKTLGPISLTSTAISQEIAVQQARLESLQLGERALSLLEQEGSDAHTAALLAVRALRKNYNPRADAALIEALTRPYPRRVFAGHTDYIMDVDFSPDGQFIATAGGWDGTARVWDASSGQVVHVFDGYSYVPRVQFSSDGQFLLTAHARLFDLTSGQQVRAFGESPLIGVLSPDGEFVATGYDNGNVELWETATGRLVRVFNEQHESRVSAIAFSPDGDRMFSGSTDGVAWLSDVSTGNTVLNLVGGSGSVDAVAYSEDGRYIATANFYSGVEIWDAESGAHLQSIPMFAPGSVAFSSDGQWISGR